MHSDGRTRAARRRTGARRVALGVVAAGAIASCGTEYSAQPTSCDDWCLATQRAECAEDWPDECVAECERYERGRLNPDCGPEWRAVIDCYRAAPDSAFTCRRDKSRPRGGVCEEELGELDRCHFAEHCARSCRALRACPARAESECMRACRSAPRACIGPGSVYAACLSSGKGDCGGACRQQREAFDGCRVRAER